MNTKINRNDSMKLKIHPKTHTSGNLAGVRLVWWRVLDGERSALVIIGLCERLFRGLIERLSRGGDRLTL